MMHSFSTEARTSADDRATEFVAVDGTGSEQYSGYTLLVEAYAAVWLILMGWLFLLWRKQRGLHVRLAGLEAAIARTERERSAAKASRRAPAELSPEAEPSV